MEAEFKNEFVERLKRDAIAGLNEHIRKILKQTCKTKNIELGLCDFYKNYDGSVEFRFDQEVLMRWNEPLIELTESGSIVFKWEILP